MSDPKVSLRGDLICYLTDTMTGEERDSFEQRLIDDGLFSDAVAAEEFELVEEFAADSLPDVERKQVQPWIEASPARQMQVLIARELRLRSLSANGKKQFAPRAVLPWAAALAACISLAVLVPALYHPHASAPPARPIATKKVEPLTADTVTTDTILLSAERLRGSDHAGDDNSYVIHRGSATRLQIMLPMQAQPASYAVSLQRDDQQHEVPLQFSGIQPQGDASSQLLEVALPAGRLASGQYRLELRSSAGSYQVIFAVERK